MIFVERSVVVVIGPAGILLSLAQALTTFMADLPFVLSKEQRAVLPSTAITSSLTIFTIVRIHVRKHSFELLRIDRREYTAKGVM